MHKSFLIISLSVFFFSCNDNGKTDKVLPSVKTDDPTPSVPAPKNIALNIIATYPHDTSAYTQGLEFHNGKLLEGTGDFELSSIRITNAKTGVVEGKHVMGTSEVFGEGITVFKNKIYQLTWENHIVHVYDVKKINQPIQTFNWPYEGWGITHSDSELVVSTGSSNLYFVDPTNFKVKRVLPVVGNNGPVESLNELEMIDGAVFANVYQTDAIVKIDPTTGYVTGIATLTGLQQQYFSNQIVPGRTDVLNGIAYDSSTKHLFFTGKRWPKMFEASFK